MIIKDFHHPATLDEARGLLKKYGSEAVVVAGATSEIFLRGERERVAIDIMRLPLSGIRREGDVFVIGATTRVADLQKHHEDGWVLDRVAHRYVTQQVRNISTVGGNVARLELWADLPVALLALDASVVVRGDAERVQDVDAFFSGPPTQLLREGELVTAVRVPAVGAGTGFAYRKEVRANADYSTVTISVAMKAQGGSAKDVRVAMGGDRIPLRLKHVEQALEGRPAGESAFRDAAEAGMARLKWAAAWGLSGDFIRNLATVTLTDALAEAWGAAKGRKGGAS